MAYIIGILEEDEEEELKRRGWDVEAAPKHFKDTAHPEAWKRMRMVFVDSSMFGVMNGPDWEKKA